VTSLALRLAARLRRALRLGWRAAGRGVIEFINSDNLTFAASIAYYSLLSLFPFLLLVLWVLNAVAIGPRGASIASLVEAALPSNVSGLVTIIREYEAPVELSVAGVAVLLWASMGVFGAITSAVNHAWGVEKPPGFFKHKLIAFVMLMAAGVLLVAALILVSLVQVVEARWFETVLAYYPAMAEVTGFAYRSAPTIMVIGVLGLIYYYVPAAKVRLRDVWFGAVLAGLLWRLALEGFSVYFRGASRYSLESSVATIIVFLGWIYLSAVILLYGVEVTATYARLRKHIPAEQPAAPVRDE
jgi:membrane protein